MNKKVGMIVDWVTRYLSNNLRYNEILVIYIPQIYKINSNCYIEGHIWCYNVYKAPIYVKQIKIMRNNKQNNKVVYIKQ